MKLLELHIWSLCMDMDMDIHQNLKEISKE